MEKDYIELEDGYKIELTPRPSGIWVTLYDKNKLKVQAPYPTQYGCEPLFYDSFIVPPTWIEKHIFRKTFKSKVQSEINYLKEIVRQKSIINTRKKEAELENTKLTEAIINDN